MRWLESALIMISVKWHVNMIEIAIVSKTPTLCAICDLYACNMNMWLSVNGYDYYVNTWYVCCDMILGIWVQNDICEYMIENVDYDTCVWLHNGCLYTDMYIMPMMKCMI